MAVSYTLPFGREDNIKNLVFSILTKEYPLKIIDLTNHIRKRYGRSVTFQAVRKAVLELVEEGILLREGHEFLIDKEWVLSAKTKLDVLYKNITEKSHRPKQEDSIGREVSVFTFNSLNEMMLFWQDVIDDWYRKLNSNQKEKTLNYYQAAHSWEALLHLEKEKAVMGKLKKKNVQSTILCTGNTPLDRSIRRFYRKIGVSFHISSSSSSFDKGFYVGTYGDIIVQSQYPDALVKRLDEFFRKNKTLEDFELEELSGIANTKTQVKLTVIKNKAMAEQMNKSIIAQMS